MKIHDIRMQKILMEKILIIIVDKNQFKKYLPSSHSLISIISLL